MQGMAARETAKVGIINLNVIFSDAMLARQAQEQEPLIDAPIDSENSQVMPKEVVMGIVSEEGVDAMVDEEMVEQYNEGMSVTNGIGQRGQTKDEVMTNMQFLGISNNEAGSTIGAGAANMMACTRQGKIAVTNMWDGRIRPGDKLRVDMAANTAEARRISAALEHVLNTGTKKGYANRNTYFLRPITKEHIINSIFTDLVAVLRNPGATNTFSFTRPMVLQMRELAIVFGAISEGILRMGEGPGADLAAGLAAIRRVAAERAHTGHLAAATLRGEHDRLIAAVLSPQPRDAEELQEEIVPGGIGGARDDSTPAQKILHHYQTNGGMQRTLAWLDLATSEAGRRWVVGEATTGANVGDTYTVILHS